MTKEGGNMKDWAISILVGVLSVAMAIGFLIGAVVLAFLFFKYAPQSIFVVLGLLCLWLVWVIANDFHDQISQ